MTISLTLCSVVVIAEGPDGSEMILRHLAAALQEEAEATMRRPTTIFLSPFVGPMASFVERCRVWLVDRGIGAEVEEW